MCTICCCSLIPSPQYRGMHFHHIVRATTSVNVRSPMVVSEPCRKYHTLFLVYWCNHLSRKGFSHFADNPAQRKREVSHCILCLRNLKQFGVLVDICYRLTEIIWAEKNFLISEIILPNINGKYPITSGYCLWHQTEYRNMQTTGNEDVFPKTSFPIEREILSKISFFRVIYNAKKLYLLWWN